MAFPYQITPYDHAYETSTPVATPGGPSAQYALKPWTEQDALELMRTMDAYAAANHVIVPFRSLYEFIRAQLPVRLAALEFLARYKNSPYEKDVRWRLAFADAWLTNPESDAWVIQQVEDGFNRGAIREDTLDTALTPYGFEITALVNDPEAPNFQCLFGSQPLTVSGLPGLGDARILIIRAIEQDNGLVVALTKDKNDRYRLTLIRNGVFRWGLGVCQSAAAQDLTGDGIQEIVISEVAASGSMRDGAAYIYQWRQDRFVEITGGGIGTWDDEVPYDIQTPTEPDGSKSIRPRKQVQLNTLANDTWRWDGEQFSMAERRVVFPLHAWTIGNGAIKDALANGQYAEVENQLRDPLSVDVSDSDAEPALADYLTFELAVSQALMFQADAARETLQTLVDAPHRPDLTALPNAARRFLGVYREETDLYRACHAALSYYNTIPSRVKDAAGNAVKNPAVPIGYYYGALDLCDPQIMLTALVEKIAPSLSGNVPADFQRYGVQPLYSQKLDINEDGNADWLVIPSFPKGSSQRIWFFLHSGVGYQIASAPAASGSAVRVEKLRLPGDDHPAVLLTTGDRLQLYRYRFAGDTLKVDRGLDIERVKNFKIIPQDDGSALDIAKNARYADHLSPLRGIYQWDSAEQKFIPQDYYERALLVSGQREAAAQEIADAITRLVPGMKEEYDRSYETARLRYLLGLSYELSGEVEKAASTYYALWRSQPDQPYGLMAREKLQDN